MVEDSVVFLGMSINGSGVDAMSAVFPIYCPKMIIRSCGLTYNLAVVSVASSAIIRFYVRTQIHAGWLVPFLLRCYVRLRTDTPPHRMRGVLGSLSWLATGPSRIQQ